MFMNNNGSFFAGNNNNGSFFAGNNNGSNFNAINQLRNWFTRTLDDQLMQLFQSGNADEPFCVMAQKIGQQNADAYINFINKECNGDIGNASPQFLTAKFAEIVQNIAEIIKEQQQQRMFSESNNMLNGLAGNNGNRGGALFTGGTGAFGSGGNRGGYEPLRPLLNNNYNDGQQPRNFGGNSAASAFGNIDGPRRAQNDNAMRDPEPANPTPYYNRIAETNTRQVQAPTEQQIPSAEVEDGFFYATPLKRVFTNSERNDAPVMTRSGFLRRKGETTLRPVSKDVIEVATVLNTSGDDTDRKYGEFCSTVSSALADNGITYTPGEPTVSKVSETVKMRRASTPRRRFNQHKLDACSLLDGQNNNYRDLTVEDASVITEMKNGTMTSTHVINASTEVVIIDEEKFVDSILDGSMADARVNNGSDVNPLVDETTNVFMSVNFDTAKVVDIPFEVMEKEFENIRHICAKHTAATFDKWYDELTDMLYDMKRKHSESIEELMLVELNTMLECKFKSFEHNVDIAPRISKWTNIYDIISGKKYFFLKDAEIAQLKEYVYDTVARMFGGSVYDPEQPEHRDFILTIPSVKELMIKYHGAAMSPEDVAGWDKDRDRDVIEKLQRNMKKFTVFTSNKTVAISSILPEFLGDADKWLYMYGDSHMDAFTLVLSGALESSPDIKELYVTDRDNGYRHMSSPKGAFMIGSTFDGYFGYLLR